MWSSVKAMFGIPFSSCESWYLDATIVRVFPGKNVEVQFFLSNQGWKHLQWHWNKFWCFPPKKVSTTVFHIRWKAFTIPCRMHSSNWWRFDRNARNKCSTSAGQDGPVKTRWEILWKSKSGTLTTIQSSGPLTIWNQYDVWVFIFHIFPVGKAPIDLSFVLFWWNRQKTWGLWIPNHVWLTKQKVNPRPRIKAIKEYCSQREGLMKWLSCTYIPLYNQPHCTFFPNIMEPFTPYVLRKEWQVWGQTNLLDRGGDWIGVAKDFQSLPCWICWVPSVGEHRRFHGGLHGRSPSWRPVHCWRQTG